MMFLERVCKALSEELALDRVSAARYDADAAEVSAVISSDGLRSADRRDRQLVTRIPVLAEALAMGTLVIVSDALTSGATGAFALPLLRGGRCLGFLWGHRGRPWPTNHGEIESLETVGLVVAVLLENAWALEEAQRLDQVKSEFVAVAAHELRTPLSSIYGSCVTLDEHADSLTEPDRLTLQGALVRQTARMRGLAEQLLDLSRVDLGAIDVAPRRLRLRSRIEELVHVLVGAEPGVVIVNVDADLEAVVDAIALDRMLSNLVANAFRHGQPPVTITAARRGTHLSLAVEDRGGGVPSGFVSELFDRFTRGPEGLRRTDGSGLGLAIARAYARAHGGDITYQPAIPHGARFEIMLPIRATAPEATTV